MTHLRPGLLGLLVLTGLLAPALPAEARALGELLAPLPSPRNAVSAISDGTHIYAFGGWAGHFSNQIVRYDPATDAMQALPVGLPSGRIWTSAAWTGTHAFVIGGATNWGVHTDQIVRFDPATQEVAVMGARLPSARSYTSAIWDGRHVWVFGGNNGTNMLIDEILRYDPATDHVEVAARLPFANDYMAAVWTGTEAYLFGGSAGLGAVVRYVPGQAVAERTPATFLLPVNGMSAAWDGEAAYVFGGFPAGSFHSAPSTPTVWRYVPGSPVVLLHDVLPAPRANTAAVWHGDHAYILGGSLVALASSLVADNVRYTPGFEGVVQVPRLVEWVGGLVPVVPGFSQPGEVLEATLDAPGGAVPAAEGWVWDTTGIPDGPHALDLRTDGRGGQRDTDTVRIGVDNTPPVVHGFRPGSGETWVLGQRVARDLPAALVVGGMQVAAHASDASSGVARVDFLVDGTLRRSASGGQLTAWWDAGAEAAGPHVLEFRATDRVGNVGTTARLVVHTVPTSAEGAAATLGATLAALGPLPG
jgi:hypothetical protein